MYLERLEVEEGFLHGLSLEFDPGLNVIIGARGSGKTSIIELIRYCLAVPAFTERVQGQASRHADSVLANGRVSIHLNDNGLTLPVTRAANENRTRFDHSLDRVPLILSQGEIESIALDSFGRLRLLDQFLPKEAIARGREETLRASIRSASARIESLTREMQAIEDQQTKLRSVPSELKAAEAEAQQALRSVSGAEADRNRLVGIDSRIAAASARQEILRRTVGSVENWLKGITQALKGVPGIQAWPHVAGPDDLLAPLRETLKTAASEATRPLDNVRRELQALEIEDREITTSLAKLQDEARVVRRELEELQEGAGTLQGRVSQLRERQGNLNALQAVVNQRMHDLHEAQIERTKLLDELDALRHDRFEMRASVARQISEAVGSRIEITVRQYGLHQSYRDAIADALRGSGLHYNTLASAISDAVSPRELATAVEERDTTTITELTGLPVDRVERALSHLAVRGLGQVLTADLEDSVEIGLVVGRSGAIPTEHLSTGQRCTAVLPILLSHPEAVVIVDQPEDNLDNAFIVDTLISTIKKRRINGQLIFVTHNPNIPVLGDADKVIMMEADGSRGFKRAEGPLMDPEIVQSITSVMEGGLKAFHRRARFYDETLPPASDG